MAKKLLLAGAIIGLLTTASSQPVLAHPTDAVVLISIVELDSFTKTRTTVKTGSGFLIDGDGHIVTARHVIRQAEEPNPKYTIEVSLGHREAKGVTAQPVECGRSYIDICVIKVAGAAIRSSGIRNFFAPSCRSLKPNEAISSLGFPEGTNNPVLTIPGNVTGELAAELKFPSNVAIVPNMSGGPVVDKDGHAVALNAGASQLNDKMTFLQPLSYGQSLFLLAGISCSFVPSSPSAANALPSPPHSSTEPCTALSGSAFGSKNTTTPCTDPKIRGQTVLRSKYAPFPEADYPSLLRPTVIRDDKGETQRITVFFVYPSRGKDGALVTPANLVNVYAYQTTPNGRVDLPPGTFPMIHGRWNPGDEVKVEINVPTSFFEETSGWKVRLCIGTTASCFPSGNLLNGVQL